MNDAPKVPGTGSYDEIVERLGHIIPCYDKRDGKTGGCHAHEDENCEYHGGCWMLQIYKAGYIDGLRAATSASQ